MGYKMRLLIIEDERALADALKVLLEKNKYLVDTAYDGETGLYHALSGTYDAILLDIMLPKINGVAILKQIRAEKIQTPVLMLTAKSELEDKVRGLDCGADDYVTKPFETEELLARVRALLRRKTDLIEVELQFGDIMLNRNTYQVTCETRAVKLGLKEFQILELLMIHKNQILTKEMLIEKVWGYDGEAEYNNVEVYISFLRKKLAHIHSNIKVKVTRGVGYSLEVEQ